MDSLRAAFDAYLQVVASKTQALRAGPQSRGGVVAVLKPERGLHDIVKSLEKGAEFKELARRTRPAFGELARRTRAAFPDDLYPVMSDNLWSESEAPKVVKHFLRRRGAYSQYLGESKIDAANLFAEFEGALKQTQMVVWFLAPLQFVSFPRDLECGSFSIKHFSREALDEILQTAVNQVFYAGADTEKLCNYWFLVAEERQSVLGSRTTESYASYSYLVHPADWDNVFASWQAPPGPIKRALEVLSLFDWERAAKWSSLGTNEGWGRFHLPFVILTDNALLRAPPGVPDCSRLPKKPVIRARLKEDASSQVESFSRDLSSLLMRYRGRLSLTPRQKRRHHRKGRHPEWYFLEIAITYFVRAFQTEGLDQLLWHWVAIEALVGGGPDEPVSRTIRDRLKRMLGSTESDQEEIKEQFEQLYRLRNDLVHGNVFLGSVPGTDLYNLRELARQSILWVARRTCPTTDDACPLPSRAQLLSVLDSSEVGHDKREAEA
jgi:hypothetical protein